MGYLFTQVWILLLIAFVLGWVAHWFLCCRNKDSESSNEEVSAVTPTISEPLDTPVNEDWKPLGFASRPDRVDDIKRIKGIGKVIEQTLNELGFYQFEQIAKWDQDNIKWVENFLSFPGRIEREDWINQAKTLTSGGDTEFSQRVDKGELEY